MIPVATQGQSFKGAFSYHLHDKRREGESERLTAERVAWTHTRNLPTDDPDKAWRIMDFTARHQREIKAIAGQSLSGPRCRKPVYSLVLAWDPSQSPSKDEMLHAAESALKVLRMSDRQAVIVCHNDEPQKHVHILVNRVCHLTGRAADIKRDWLKLSKWAERYERETGQIFCDLRVNHNYRRGQGEYVKNENLTRKEYEIVRLYMRMTEDQIRERRATQQDSDRQQLGQRQTFDAARFENTLDELYGAARRNVAHQISTLEGQRDLKGLFAAIVRFKKRLTGEIARQELEISRLKKTLANLDLRITEQRQTFERRRIAETQTLDNRHRVERERDERLIAHARGRIERENMRLKARINFAIRSDKDQRFLPKTKDRQKLRQDLPKAARDSGPGLLDRLIQKLDGPADAETRKRSLVDVRPDHRPEPERDKKWSRKDGRGAHRKERPHRPRRNRDHE